jgi:hypothetical protein
LAVAERGSSAGWVRVVTAVLLALAVIAPVAAIATWASADNGENREFVEGERRGVEYLQPLTKLLGVLIASQSAAVRGEVVETAALDAELAAVERVEARHGEALSTRSRWPTLRDSIKELGQRPGTPGAEAYQRWGQAVDLTVALIRRVGDTSRLILDPELDSYYLMDAGMIRLPEVAQAAGQLADLAVVNRTLSSADPRASVLRDRIATNAAAVATGLGKVVDATGSGRVGSAILSPLDQFGAATDALAPSVAVAVMPPLPDNLNAAAVGVRDASQRLSQTVWNELDSILADRESGYSVRRVQVYSAATLGVLVAILVGVVVWMRRRPGRGGSDSGTYTSTGRHSSPVDVGPDVPPGQHYPGYPDPAVTAIVGSPRAPAGVR